MGLGQNISDYTVKIRIELSDTAFDNTDNVVNVTYAILMDIFLRLG